MTTKAEISNSTLELAVAKREGNALCYLSLCDAAQLLPTSWITTVSIPWVIGFTSFEVYLTIANGTACPLQGIAVNTNGMLECIRGPS
jgi:hypothetical protein